MAILEIQELSLTAQGEILLADINLAVAKGEIIALIGPSGAGKTTLLRLIAGLDQPCQGKIFFQEQDITAVPPHLRSIGMMFQEYALFPHRDVAANIAFGLEMQKIDRHLRDEKVSEVLKLTGLQGFERRTVASLSGGERQRVALARCLAPQPRLLLLDEPLASLDLQLRERLADEIRTILKRLAITAIFVTHDQSEAFAVADRIAILHEGRLQQCSTPEGVYLHPASTAVASFLGFRNIFPAAADICPNLVHGAAHRPAADGSMPGEQAESLLIRPDAASIVDKSTEDPNEIVLHGTVERVRFQGRLYQVTLIVKNYRLVFELPLDPVPPDAGESISLVIKPNAIILLPSS